MLRRSRPYPKGAVNQRRRPDAAKRLRRMHVELLRAYGPQHWWPAKTPFEVILGAYLTQNTAWKAVERSLENLRAARALTLEGLRGFRWPNCGADPAVGIHHAQGACAEGVCGHARQGVWRFAGGDGRNADRRASPATARIARRRRETADAILLYALGHAVPVADEYLRRIAERHGLLAPPRRRERISYDAIAELTRRAFAGDPVGEPRETLQRVPCADGGRGQGALRADGAVRELSAGGGSEEQLLAAGSRPFSLFAREVRSFERLCSDPKRHRLRREKLAAEGWELSRNLVAS